MTASLITSPVCSLRGRNGSDETVIGEIFDASELIKAAADIFNEKSSLVGLC
jgi:hypothetical protein